MDYKTLNKIEIKLSRAGGNLERFLEANSKIRQISKVTRVTLLKTLKTCFGVVRIRCTTLRPQKTASGQVYYKMLHYL